MTDYLARRAPTRITDWPGNDMPEDYEYEEGWVDPFPIEMEINYKNKPVEYTNNENHHIFVEYANGDIEGFVSKAATAKHLGVSVGSVRNWCRGERPTKINIFRIWEKGQENNYIAKFEIEFDSGDITKHHSLSNVATELGLPHLYQQEIHDNFKRKHGIVNFKRNF